MNVLIAGPPGAGKTTLAYQLAHEHGGTVVDWDEIAAELTGRPMHDRSAPYPPLVEEEFQARARQARADLLLVRSAPTRQNRAALARIYSAQRLVLETPMATCLERIAYRPDAYDHARAVRDWWAQYERSTNDIHDPAQLPSARARRTRT